MAKAMQSALVLAAILSAFGAWLGSEYAVLREVDLSNWVSRDAATTAAIASGLAGVVAMLAGLLGGVRGERYRRADRSVAGTQPGAMVARDPEASQ